MPSNRARNDTMKYILGRLAQLIPVLILATGIVFLAVRLAPGDPALIKLGPRGGNSPAALAQVRHEMGLDRPLYVQYLYWVRDVARGDFGVSLLNGVGALKIVASRVPASLELIFVSLIMALVLSVLLGVRAATRPGSLMDQSISSLATGLVSVPTFWVALLLLSILAVHWRILPASGYVRFARDPLANLRFILMPSISLALAEVGVFTRFIRAGMIEVLGSTFIRAARAKGLRKRRIYLLHALKNILVTVTTVVGLEIGALIGGTLLVEQIFGWSGIGWLLFESIGNRDYAVLQCIVFLVVVAYVLINLIVDVIYVIVDPRVEL
jgi:peptide/nickel transport system permease protein